MIKMLFYILYQDQYAYFEECIKTNSKHILGADLQNNIEERIPKNLRLNFPKHLELEINEVKEEYEICGKKFAGLLI